QLTLRDSKRLVPVTIIKQVIQNRTQSKTSDSSSLPGAILVHLIVPGLNETQQKLPPLLTIDDIPQASRKKMAKNETQVWPAESKTPEVQEISPQSLPAQAEKKHGPEEIKSTSKPELVQTQNILASNEIQPVPSGSRISDAPKSPLTELVTQSPALKSLPSAETREVEMTFEEIQHISSGSQTYGATEVQPTTSASHEFDHVTSTQTFTASEIPDTAGDTTEWEISMPILTTEPQLLETTLGKIDKIALFSYCLDISISFPCLTVATQRSGLESFSSASPETTRTVMATRRPRLKFTTPPSLATQQTMMAFDEKQHISSTFEPSHIQEMPSTVPGNACKFLEPTSFPSLENTRTFSCLILVTQRPKLKSTSPYLANQGTVEATWRPRLKTTTPPSLVTQQTMTDNYGVQPVLSSPVTPSEPETADAGPATSESILESFTPKTSHPLQWPRVTLAPKEIPLIPSKLKPSATPEVQHVKPAPTSSLLKPETSKVFERQKATLAPKEAKLTPSSRKPRPPGRRKKPRTKPASMETQRFHLPKSTPKPHIPQAKDVLESITLRTDQLKPTIVPKETQHVPSKHRTSSSPEVPQTKPVLEPITFRTEKPRSTVAPKDTRHGLSKPKISPSPHIPTTRASPKERQRVSSKSRASPRPDAPHTKPAQEEPQHTPFKHKAAPTRDAPHSKPEIIPTFHEPDTTMIPHIPERTNATLAPTEKQFIHTKSKPSEKPRMPHTKPAIRQTTPQPIITKSSTITEHSRATMAPKETLLILSKPKTSVGPEVPQTKPAPKATHLGSINLITVHVVDGSKMTLVPNATYQISPKPKTALATEIPQFHTAPHKTRLTSTRPKPSDKSQTRPALSKTTVAPARKVAPGLPKWIVPTTDEAYTPEDIERQIDVDVKKPLEHSDTWEKPFSVTTSPGPQHPLVPPVKPTQMRRKPLPPNTVTGKPGSPAKAARPTSPVRTGTSYKTPTAFATPEYYVDVTVFSSSPTSETDSSGKPRYQAPHVKYMKKDHDVPCSITSSLEHFPQEEGGAKEEPTRPPQNPPTNLTVVTVEGCPTFVILDWEKPENDSVTEYEIVSTENGASDGEKEKSIITTNQTHSTVENLKPDTSYEFHVKPRNPLGEGPSSNVVAFSTESGKNITLQSLSSSPAVGKDAIWTEIPFNSDTYSECKGKQYVKRTWYKKFVGVQLCNSLRYKIYLSDSLTGKFYNIGDQRGHGEDHCQFVDSFLDGRTGQQEDLPVKDGFFRAVRQEPVKFGKIGGETHINYVRWYECGTSIPGKW
ncbi:TARSH protein, partial [Geococcyx californianus]|nr:TARSH protein [Geococcyx californianus]